MIVYLCGGMTGMTPEDASGWRGIAIKRLVDAGFTVTSPMRVEKNHLTPGEKIGADMFGEKSEISEMRPSAIYERDMFDVRQADIILANMNDSKGSLGSTWEMGYAKGIGSATIILVARPGNVYREHPITSQGAGVIFDELNDALAYMCENYEPYLN